MKNRKTERDILIKKITRKLSQLKRRNLRNNDLKEIRVFNEEGD
jgi:hypothetical protein